VGEFAQSTRRLDHEGQVDDDVDVVDASNDNTALSSTSAVIFRGLDFWYFPYDNEPVGNAGVHRCCNGVRQ
jgi:hypothetical protein